MPNVKESALVSNSIRRNVIIDTDNNVWISNAALNIVPKQGAQFEPAGYTNLYGLPSSGAKAPLRGVVVEGKSGSILIFDFDGRSSQWSIGATGQTQTTYAAYSVATTQTAARTETALVTFSPLQGRETLTIAGKTLTVRDGQSLTASEAASAFALSNLTSALAAKVTISGALSGYTVASPAANATSVTLTSTTTNTNVTDLVVTGSPKVSILISDGVPTSAVRTETALVTFSPLQGRETLTIAGKTLTVRDGQSLTASEAASAFALSNLTSALAAKVTVSGALSGYTVASPAANATSVTLTSITTGTNVTDLFASGAQAPKASVVVTQGQAARTETATVTFSVLQSGETLTIAGKTMIVKAGQTLNAAEAVSAFASSTLPPSLAAKVTVTGSLSGYTVATPAANATSVTLTSTTTNTNVTNLVASGTPKVGISITQGIPPEVTSISFQTPLGTDGKFTSVNYTTSVPIPEGGLQVATAVNDVFSSTASGPINLTTAGTTAPKVYALTDSFVADAPQPGLPTYSSLVAAPAGSSGTSFNLFLYRSTAESQTLNSTNSLRILADAGTMTDLRSRLDKPNTGIFLARDAKNYHLIFTDHSGTNTLSLNPIDIVISGQTGQIISRESLDHSSLNYILNQADIGRMYDLAGGLLDTGKRLVYVEEKYEVGDSLLKLYSVSQNTIDSTGDEVTRSLGMVLSSSTSAEQVSALNSYYLGSGFVLDEFIYREPNFFEKDNTLIIIWDDLSKADPIYMRLEKGSALAYKDKLSLDKLLSLEAELDLDINGDGRKNGTIEYVETSKIKLTGTAVTTLPLYKTHSDVFFVLKPTVPALPAAGAIDRVDLNRIIDLVSPSRLRDLELLNQLDLNDDGVVGTGVLSTIIENENFSIYKTTAGDLVWSAARGLEPGDQIPDAVSISFALPLSGEDQEIIETAIVVVASIQQSGRLLSIAAQVRDPMTGTTVLRESNFLFNAALKTYAPSSTAAQPPGPLPSVIYTYGYSTAERQIFLQRELYYDFDLNGDGLIGDAISEQLASNDIATIYRTAAGAVYASPDPTRNPGDSIDGAYLLYDLSNCPDRIDAAVFNYTASNAISGVRVFFSDIDNKNPQNNKYYSELFALESGVLKSKSKTLLQPYELLQTEVTNKIDINNDGILGDTIEARKFSSSLEDGNQSFGIYQLKTKFNDTPIFIAARDGEVESGTEQPLNGVVYLRNTAGSANPFWSIPKYRGVEGEVVGAGQNSLTNDRVQLVIQDKGGKNAFYLVNFDQAGGTVKPNGTLMSSLLLHNTEIILGTDLSKDGKIGDSVTKIAASDSFGLYQLDRSGIMALTKENSWVEIGSSGTQQSINFTSLKNTNGSTWLPFGWKQQLRSDGTYSITKNNDAASVLQSVIRPDGTSSIFLSRKISGPQGTADTVYEVSFSAQGIAKKPSGTALRQSDFYKTEMSSLTDINGDSFVGKPFLGLPVMHNAVGAKNLFFEYYGYESFADRSIVVTSSKFSGKQFTIKLNVGDTYAIGWDSYSFENKASLEVYDQKANLVSRINTAAGSQILLGGGDFNGDGKGDFAAVDWIKNQIVVYRGDDNGNFSPSQQIVMTFEDQATLPKYRWSSSDYSHSKDWVRPRSYGVVNDFNNDGLSELAILEASSNKAQFKGNDVLGIYANQKGKLALVDTVVLGTNEFSDIVAGDLNKDGFSDLVLVGSGNNSLKVIFSQKGSFSSAGKALSELDLSGIFNPDHARIADLNNDGNQDIIFGSKDASGAGLIQAFFGDGMGDFTTPQTLAKSLVGTTGGFELIDVNNDRQLDVRLATGLVYLNVSNIVESKGTYNFKSVNTIWGDKFASDYKNMNLPVEFRLRFDPSKTIIAQSGERMDISSPSPLKASFDTRGGATPQISIDVTGDLDIVGSKFLTGQYSENLPERLYWDSQYRGGLIRQGEHILRGESPDSFFISQLNRPSNSFDITSTSIKYVAGDKLFFNESGSIQVLGFFLGHNNYGGFGIQESSVRLLWKPDRYKNDSMHKFEGTQVIDIIIPTPTKAELAAWQTVDSIRELNSLLGDSQFINLAASRSVEANLVGDDYLINSSRAFFDVNQPTIFRQNAFGKFDQGDVIDFAGAYYGGDATAPSFRFHSTVSPLEQYVNAYNDLVYRGDNDLLYWFANYPTQFPNGRFEPMPLMLKKPSSDLFWLEVAPNDLYPSFINDPDKYATINIHYKGFDNETSWYENRALGVPLDYSSNEYINSYIAEEFIVSHPNKFPFIGDVRQLSSFQSMTPSAMTLLFDKQQFSGIENVQSVEDLVELIGVSSVMNLDLVH
jgi:hypothetical protein